MPAGSLESLKGFPLLVLGAALFAATLLTPSAESASGTVARKKSSAKRVRATATPVPKRRPVKRRPANPRTVKPRTTKPARAPVVAPVPIEHPEALESFFEGLSTLPPAGSQDLGEDVVRILHFGDSHVAADYWTGEIRRRLQGRFGDAGPGYVMPGRPWRYFRHALARSPKAEGWETAGLGPDPKDGLYGLSGVALVPAPGTQPAALEGDFRVFEAQILSLAPSSCVSIAVDGVTVFAGTLDGSSDPTDESDLCSILDVDPVEGGPAQFARISNAEPLPEGPHRIEIRDACGGLARILGVDLASGRSGVLIDALGVNGAEITALAKWSAPLLSALLSHARPGLAIVSYGTNDIGRTDFVFEDYRAECVRVLSGLRAAAPEMPVLVTGPVDRGARGRRAPRALLNRNEPLVIRALREAAQETGCAFWDAKAAMGGDGAIDRWAAARLAQPDRVHLTGTGYAKLAGLLVDQLLGELDRSRLRPVAGSQPPPGSSPPR